MCFCLSVRRIISTFFLFIKLYSSRFFSFFSSLVVCACDSSYLIFLFSFFMLVNALLLLLRFFFSYYLTYTSVFSAFINKTIDIIMIFSFFFVYLRSALKLSLFACSSYVTKRKRKNIYPCIFV